MLDFVSLKERKLRENYFEDKPKNVFCVSTHWLSFASSDLQILVERLGPIFFSPNLPTTTGFTDKLVAARITRPIMFSSISSTHKHTQTHTQTHTDRRLDLPLSPAYILMMVNRLYSFIRAIMRGSEVNYSEHIISKRFRRDRRFSRLPYEMSIWYCSQS